MPIDPITAQLGAAVIGKAGNFIQSKINRNTQNEYNSPAAHIERLKAAGLSPSMYYNGSASQQADVGLEQTDMDMSQNIIAASQQAKTAAEINKAKAETNILNTEAAIKQNELKVSKGITDYKTQTVYGEGQGFGQQQVIELMDEADTKKYKKQAAQHQAAILEAQSQNEKERLLKENLLKDAQTAAASSGIELNEKKMEQLQQIIEKTNDTNAAIDNMIESLKDSGWNDIYTSALKAILRNWTNVIKAR